jgi:hypothetical protein
MLKNALTAALEGLVSDDTGGLEGSATGGETNGGIIPNDSTPPTVGECGDIQALLVEAEAQLESFYGNNEPGAVFTQADQLRDYMEENDAAHEVMREDIKDLRNHMEAVSGSMEMLSLFKSMESVDDHAIRIANITLESLGRHLPYATPTLEARDGHVTTASMEGLIDFLKAGAAKIKNWFKDVGAAMELSSLRQQTTYAGFQARIKRVQGIISKLPEEHGRPVTAINYADPYVCGLYSDGKPIEFTEAALVKAMKEASGLAMIGLNENAKERLATITSISKVLPSLLMSIGDDGGEKATRAMVESLKNPEALPKAVNYGAEHAGGVTYRDPTYRPSVRTASWAQPMVEIIERDRASFTIRRTGRSGIQVLDLSTMDKVLDEMAGYIDARSDRYNGYWGDLRDAYNDAVSAYNKTLGLAQGTDHSELTSEVWKAIDLASYVMMQMFSVIQYEAFNVGIPAARFIDSALYVIEEQLIRYVKVNR